MDRASVRVLGLGAFLGASALAGVLTGPSARPALPAAAVETGAAPISTALLSGAPAASESAPVLDAPIPGGLMPPDESRRPTTVEAFYSSLSPFGEWILIEGYGRCWRPRVGIEVKTWHPYAHGRWIATDIGWQWDSAEAWGEARPAPFHYGRWSLEGRHGWVWAPGIVWAPSWVKWRSCDGWIGWAPIPADYRWGDAPRVEREPAAEVFIFVPSVHFLDPRPIQWRVSGPEHAQVFVKAKPIVETVAFEGVVVHAGPPVAKVSVVTGVTVKPLKITPAVAVRKGPAQGPSGKPANPVKGGRPGGHR